MTNTIWTFSTHDPEQLQHGNTNNQTRRRPGEWIYMAIISEQHKQWIAEDLDYHTFLNVISDLCPLNETVSENDACGAHLYHDLFSCLLYIPAFKKITCLPQTKNLTCLEYDRITSDASTRIKVVVLQTQQAYLSESRPLWSSGRSLCSLLSRWCLLWRSRSLSLSLSLSLSRSLSLPRSLSRSLRRSLSLSFSLSLSLSLDFDEPSSRGSVSP